MKNYDYILIGAGMGGLSTANFLAKYGKKILVVEKHDKPGGCVTSFKRNGVRFDCGLEGLYELKEDETIPQFFKLWGKDIKSEKCSDRVSCFVDDWLYTFDGEHLEEDFIRQFPGKEDKIKRILTINNTMFKEMYSGTEAPKPPYDMSLVELIKFGMSNKKNKPFFMKYGMKNASDFFNEVDDDIVSSILFSKAGYEMVYMGYAYRWSVLGKNHYPVGGMQAIPDLAVEAMKEKGAEIKLQTEIEEVLIRDNAAVGVRSKGGEEFYADTIISNVSPEYTLKMIPDQTAGKAALKRKTEKREIFPSTAILFAVVDREYTFNGSNYISILDSDAYKHIGAYTKDDCPIMLQISPMKAEEKNRAITILVPLRYEYEDHWRTGQNGERGAEYRKFKEEVKETILDRIEAKLGRGFKDSLVYCEISTPFTYERYLHSSKGSFMGYAIDKKNYGRFLKQETPIKKLYLVGQYVFPGFGVAGVMASGYYLAKELLKKDNINLEHDFKEFFDK